MMYQLPERLYKSLDSVVLMLRFRLPFPMLAYPFYLANRTPASQAPTSTRPATSSSPTRATTCWLAMAALLAALTL